MVKTNTWNSSLEYIKLWKPIEIMEIKNKVIMRTIVAQ